MKKKLTTVKYELDSLHDAQWLDMFADVILTHNIDMNKMLREQKARNP